MLWSTLSRVASSSDQGLDVRLLHTNNVETQTFSNSFGAYSVVDLSAIENVATEPHVDEEESMEARIQRLGRERPPAFKTA